MLLICVLIILLVTFHDKGIILWILLLCILLQYANLSVLLDLVLLSNPILGGSELPKALSVRVPKEKMKVHGIAVFALSKIIQKRSNVLCAMFEKEHQRENLD